MEVAPGVFQDARHWFGPKGLSVIAEIAQTVNHGLLLHVSLAYRDRLPAWRDIRVIREAFFPPDIDAMMVLPRQSDYVNAHPYCFHIWETPTEWALQ